MSAAVPDAKPEAANPAQTPRVVFYEAYPGFRGAQRSLAVLARGLAARGFGVEIWCGAEGRARPGFERAGLSTRSVIPAPGALRRFGRSWRRLGLPIAWLRHVVGLTRQLRNARPSLVHCNQLRGLLIIGPAARLLRIPVVWHQRGVLEETASGIARLARLGQWLAQRVVCVSQAVRRTLPDPDSPRVVVVPNGLENEPDLSVESLDTTRRRITELAAERGVATPFTLVTASALTPYKGLHHVASTLALLRQRRGALARRTLWLILGDAEPVDRQRRYREFLEHRIGTLGLDSRVVWLGWQDDPRPWMALADAVLLPTIERERLQYPDGTVVEAVCSEGFPRTVLEAMAVAAPVVASSVAGVDEQIEPGVDGWIVPPGDSEALADTLERLKQDPEASRRIGRAAKSAARRFSAEAMTSSIEILYRELLPLPSFDIQ